MNTTFSFLIFFLIITLIVFLIWNLVFFKKNIKSKNDNRDYLELKYQQQFYVAVFSVLIGVFSFLGYSSYNEMIKKIKTDISKETDSIISKTKESIKRTDDELSKISSENEKIRESNNDILEKNEKSNDRFYSLYERFLNLNSELYNSKNQLQSQINNVSNAEKDVKNIKKDIEEINKIDFLKQIYLVTGLSYSEPKTYEKRKIDTVYFNKLKTISKSDLPIFTSPPSIAISSYQGVQLSIKDVSNEYFTITMSSQIGFGLEENEKIGTNHKYDILIIYKETGK
jgi:hypothetical protein